MTDAEVFFAVLFGLLTMIGLAWLRWHHLRMTAEAAAEAASAEISRHSHDVKNQVTSVRAGLRRIKESPDPLVALVRTIRGEE